MISYLYQQLMRYWLIIILMYDRINMITPQPCDDTQCRDTLSEMCSNLDCKNSLATGAY
jgi:hypothetical protein